MTSLICEEARSQVAQSVAVFSKSRSPGGMGLTCLMERTEALRYYVQHWEGAASGMIVVKG